MASDWDKVGDCADDTERASEVGEGGFAAKGDGGDADAQEDWWVNESSQPGKFKSISIDGRTNQDCGGYWTTEPCVNLRKCTREWDDVVASKSPQNASTLQDDRTLSIRLKVSTVIRVYPP